MLSHWSRVSVQIISSLPPWVVSTIMLMMTPMMDPLLMKMIRMQQVNLFLFEVLNSTLKSIKTSCTVEFHHIEFHYFFVVNKNKLFWYLQIWRHLRIMVVQILMLQLQNHQKMLSMALQRLLMMNQRDKSGEALWSFCSHALQCL